MKAKRAYFTNAAMDVSDFIRIHSNITGLTFNPDGHKKGVDSESSSE